MDILLRSLQAPEAEIYSMRAGFPEVLEARVRTAKRYIIDTNLNQLYAFREEESPQDRYRAERDWRLINKEIWFHQVVSIQHRSLLEDVMAKIILAEESSAQLLIRYLGPTGRTPMLHVMSFDGEGYFLGGYHLSEPGLEQQALYLRSEATDRFFASYWDYLWNKASPLNEDGDHWGRLSEIARELGMTVSEFQSLRLKVSREVRTRLRTLRP